MKILVTGSNGFVGKNLCASLKNIKEGKDRTRPRIDAATLEVLEYDLDCNHDTLENYCQEADFVLNFAGVNRPKDQAEFMSGNCGFLNQLLETLEKYGNKCPVLHASSIQASLVGRFANSEYGRSKKISEELMFEYSKRTGAKVLVFRFTNLFGKWCRPNYNSVVATFCHNIACDLPITISDPATELILLYIDDMVSTVLDCIEGIEHRCEFNGLNVIPTPEGRYCYCPINHKTTLGEIAELLYSFHKQPSTLILPEIPQDSFEKKLYSTYLSYLPKDKVAFPLKTNSDARGTFTELLKTDKCGQVSVNISKPGVTKGQHWHHSKWEFFIVVSGHGLIQQRRIDSDEVIEFEVSGDNIQAVHMLPGYTHNIINLSDKENLVTVMWANEQFDPSHPDTYYEPV